jgi:hypothetical protein
MTEEARAARMEELHGMEGLSERGDLGEGGVPGQMTAEDHRPKCIPLGGCSAAVAE